jgi:hypothetical protein
MERIALAEAGLFESLARHCASEAEEHKLTKPGNEFDYGTPQMVAGNIIIADSKEGNNLEKLSRIETRAKNTYDKANKELIQIRMTDQEDLDFEDVLVTEAIKATTAEIGEEVQNEPKLRSTPIKSTTSEEPTTPPTPKPPAQETREQSQITKVVEMDSIK